MFKRVMVAVVGIPFLLLVLGCGQVWMTMILLMGMCGIGAYELCHAVMGDQGKRLVPLTETAAALTPLCVCLEESAGGGTPLPLVGLLAAAFVFLLFLYAILHYGKAGAVSFADVTAAIFGGLVFPLMLSCLLRLRMVEAIGNLLVFLPLCIAFGSDTFALFAGMLFGKHKLSPLVSPKKTVEGAAGGVVGGVLGALLLCAVGSQVVQGPFWVFPLFFGGVGSVVSQIGDLSFSVIKREFGVKDYGRLLPGHGGILDRFDSVTFVAPFVYLALTVIWNL